MPVHRQETKQRMSRIVIHNDTVYLCGQVCKDATKDISEQTATMLELERSDMDRSYSRRAL